MGKRKIIEEGYQKGVFKIIEGESYRRGDNYRRGVWLWLGLCILWFGTIALSRLSMGAGVTSGGSGYCRWSQVKVWSSLLAWHLGLSSRPPGGLQSLSSVPAMLVEKGMEHRAAEAVREESGLRGQTPRAWGLALQKVKDQCRRTAGLWLLCHSR